MTRPIDRRAGGTFATALVCTLAAVLWIGCGPPEGRRGGAGLADGGGQEAPERFQFIRSARLLMRIDTRSGQVSFVPKSGDGGWTALGARPAGRGGPDTDNRYGLYVIDKDQNGPQLLRVDRVSGQAWIARARDGAEWMAIEDGAQQAGGADDESESDDATPPPAQFGTPSQGASAEGSQTPSPQAGQTIVLPIITPAQFGTTAEEQQANIGVVKEALHKEGLALEIKVWGARQLAHLLPEVSVPLLIETLDHEHPEVVVAAIASLQTIGDPATIPHIMALESHPDPRVRKAVQNVVVR